MDSEVILEITVRPEEIEQIVKSGPMFKMHLGQNGSYRKEALASGTLLFQMEKGIYDAVVSRDEERIKKAVARIQPERKGKNWRDDTKQFLSMPAGALVFSWDSRSRQLYWGIVDQEPPVKLRDQADDSGQEGYLINRKLLGGWRTKSLEGVPLTNIHPKARVFVICPGTVDRVASYQDFFRALLLDQDLSYWMSMPEWEQAAERERWTPKDTAALIAAHRQKAVLDGVRQIPKEARQIPDLVIQIADHLQSELMSEKDMLAEAQRMARTAVATACYANGQTVLRQIKEKEIGFTREQLEDEVLRILKLQDGCCALTGFRFNTNHQNKHLLPSLDRKDSTKGYVEGNLQIVTRAANFYKSASDEADWKAKAQAMEMMAIAIQKQRKAAKDSRA